MMKKQINLYQPSCYPKRQKASLTHFLIVFFICLSLSLFSYFLTQKQAESLNEQLAMHKVALTNQQLKLSGLVAELQKKGKPDAQIRKHEALQKEVIAKQRLLTSIADIDMQDLVSFSALMRGLSNANMPDLTISHFSMAEGVLNISGDAKHSDSVPLWLANMQNPEELSGVAFSALSIEEITGFFTFKLTNSSVEGKPDE